MKSKPCENGLKTSEEDEFDELIETLELIHKDTCIAVDESKYIHLGSMAQVCVRHLMQMKQTIIELKDQEQNGTLQ